jgi:hypothetical protein
MKKLPGEMPAKSGQCGRTKRTPERAWCIARDAVKPADLISGALVPASPRSRLACIVTKPHAPVASGGETEFSAALVAAQCHELRLHALGVGTRYPIAETELLKATL